MRLFESIIEANHAAVAGDDHAGQHPSDYVDELPVVALTCIDPRLNALFPNVLGLPGDQFIWLRNAGNVVTSPSSSTTRSLSLACAIKGGKEIVIIGHTDCLVGKTTTMQLLERLRALGIERHALPENINEYFGIFASERQNVIKAVDIVRQSPLIGPKIPVQGLLVDIQTGKLEWIVNGYQPIETLSSRWDEVVKSAGHTVDALKSLSDFNIGEMKFPETKIGETVTKAEDWLSQKVQHLGTKTPESIPVARPASPYQGLFKPELISPERAPGPPPVPPKIPMPPPLRPRIHLRKGK
jgi:carbonic anhydrase